MEDHELSPLLRQAYGGAEPELEPSPFLRARTLKALRDQGIVAGAASRRSDRLAAVAVAAAVVGFLLGWQMPDRGAGPGRDGGTGVATATSVQTALEDIQRTGAAHARALQVLTERLDHVDASTLAGAQEVYLAAERARREYSRILLAGRGAAGADSPPTPSGAGTQIWF